MRTALFHARRYAARFPTAAAPALLLTLSTAALAGHVRYRIVDLGTLGGDFTEPFDLNDNGQVVGETTNGDFDFRAFLWQNGSMRDLGTVGGPEARAIGVNNRGRSWGSRRRGRTRRPMW